MDDMLDTAPCGFLSFADDGTVRAANQTLLDLVERDRAAVVGHHIETILSSGAQLFYHTHLFPLLKMQERAEEVYLSLRTRGGTEVPCLLNARRTVRDGAAANDVVLIRFEERNQYEDEILQAKQAAEQANRAKARFLSTVSHELRTPISAIQSLSQTLALGVHGEVTDDQRDYLERIGDAAEHLNTLISDILDFSRLEAGSVDVTTQPVPVGPVLGRAEALLDMRFEDADLTYERTVDPSDLHVRADPDRLRQVLLNLLTNAVKYTEAGGSVTVTATPDDDTVHIRVRDTGSGIPAGVREHIFDPFVQAAESSDGVGLGLAISRDLTRAMDGTLTVESEEGVGSTFTIALPRASMPSAAP